jgi:hypothetical protein
MIYRVGGDISCQYDKNRYFNACCNGPLCETFKMFNWNIETRYAFMNPRKLGPRALVRWEDE